MKNFYIYNKTNIKRYMDWDDIVYWLKSEYMDIKERIMRINRNIYRLFIIKTREDAYPMIEIL